MKQVESLTHEKENLNDTLISTSDGGILKAFGILKDKFIWRRSRIVSENHGYDQFRRKTARSTEAAG